MNPHRPAPRHIVNKMAKVKERILRQQEKNKSKRVSY